MKDAKLFENYKKTINRRNVILLGVAGSELLGLAKEANSDRDEMGVCLETLPDIAGFTRFDKPDIYRTAVDRTGIQDTKSGPGDIDLTLYSLRHFLNLSLGGNPNIINLLFTPSEKCVIITDIGKELQALAPQIVSKFGIKAFQGYLQAQRLRLMGSQGQKRVNRPDLDAAYGYDTKYAMHMVRLGIQAKELLTNHALTFPLSSDCVEALQGIKVGARSMQWCLDWVSKLERQIGELLISSDLQPTPNYAGVEKWLLEVYMREWSK